MDLPTIQYIRFKLTSQEDSGKPSKLPKYETTSLVIITKLIFVRVHVYTYCESRHLFYYPVRKSVYHAYLVLRVGSVF